MSSVVSKGRNPFFLACACTLVLSAASLHAQKVIATIPVGGFVGGGAVDPIARLAYIPTGSNGTNGQVTVISEKSNTIARTINLATDWQAVSAALDPFTGLLYVGAEFGGLFVVDAKTGATVGFANVNSGSVALNPVTDKIYVSDFNSTLYVIDGATLNIEATISINAIQNVAVNPFTNRIYAGMNDFSPGYVAVVDGATNQVIAQPPAGSGLTSGVAVNPVKHTFYSSEQFGTATVYSGKTNTQVTAIELSGQPAGVAVDPFTDTLFVSEYQGNSVTLINGSTYAVTGNVPVGTQPEYMTDDPANKLLYVGCAGVDATGNPTFTISVIKTK
jgi:YVTN family beta-propeller protein